MINGHVALELPGTDPQERDPVPVPGVHVRLDLEDEAGELVVVHRNHDAVAHPGARWLGVLQEPVEQELNAEVVARAAEEHRREPAGQHLPLVERHAGMVQHLALLQQRPVRPLVQPLPDQWIGKAPDLHRSPVGSAGHKLEQVHLLRQPVEDPAELEPRAERPVHRAGPDAQHPLQLVQQLQRVLRGPVQLVHEREDRDVPPAADFEELPRLGLDPFGGVDHHDHGVHRGQHPVGVLREILVARRVQQVDPVAVVVELQDRGADRNPALPLQLHPIGGGLPLVLPGRHRSRELDRAAVQQELLGQRGLAGVRMRDDRERPPPENFFLDAHVSGITLSG